MKKEFFFYLERARAKEGHLTAHWVPGIVQSARWLRLAGSNVTIEV